MVIGTGHIGTDSWADRAISMVPANASIARRKSFAERETSVPTAHMPLIRGEGVVPLDIKNSFQLRMPEGAIKKFRLTKQTFAYQP